MRSVLQPLVAVFCLWHMFAVGVYALSLIHNDRVQWLRDSAPPLVRSYLLATSQWQQWNMFAPDPLRRVYRLTLEHQEPNQTWSPFVVYAPDILGKRQTDYTMKFVRSIDQKSHMEPLLDRLMQINCANALVSPGTRIRARSETMVIPYRQPRFTSSFWKHWVPRYEHNVIKETTCHSRNA